jgi:hypothetical protein
MLQPNQLSYQGRALGGEDILGRAQSRLAQNDTHPTQVAQVERCHLSQSQKEPASPSLSSSHHDWEAGLQANCDEEEAGDHGSGLEAYPCNADSQTACDLNGKAQAVHGQQVQDPIGLYIRIGWWSVHAIIRTCITISSSKRGVKDEEERARGGTVPAADAATASRATASVLAIKSHFPRCRVSQSLVRYLAVHPPCPQYHGLMGSRLTSYGIGRIRVQSRQ